VYGPPLFGVERSWGTAGLTASAGMAGWVEFVLLRRGLARRIGAFSLPRGLVAKLWLAAALAAGAAWGVHAVLAPHAQHGLRRTLEAAFVLAVFTAGYAAATLAMRIEAARVLLARIRRRGN